MLMLVLVGFKVVDIDRFKAEQAARLVSENTNTQEYKLKNMEKKCRNLLQNGIYKSRCGLQIPLFKKNTFGRI